MTPFASSPTTSGAQRADLDGSPGSGPASPNSRARRAFAAGSARLTTQRRRVSTTCLPEADRARSARRGSGRRARSCTGSASGRPAGRRSPMSTTWASKISLDLVADEVVHRLHVELGGEALLDAVDDRQLGRPLVGLGQQALASRRTAGRSRGRRPGCRERARAAARRPRRTRLARGSRGRRRRWRGRRRRSGRRATTRLDPGNDRRRAPTSSASVPIRSACFVSMHLRATDPDRARWVRSAMRSALVDLVRELDHARLDCRGSR